MSETPAPQPDLQYDCYFMIPDAAGRRVLLLAGGAGWTLPHWHPADPDLWAVDTVRTILREQLGADVTVLRVAQAHIDREIKKQVIAIYALENHDPAWAPPAGARWVAPDELAGLPLEPPEAREAVTTWLAEESSGIIPAARSPWARPGWLARATHWVAAELARRDLTLRGPLVQVKTWGISCLLRGETETGAVYFKATPGLPLFTHEPAVTAALARLYPAAVPTPLAVEPAERWMLLADFGGPILGDAEASASYTVAPAFGALQRDSVGQIEALLAAGCLDRRLPRLAAGIDPLIQDTTALPRLTAAEKTRLAEAAPRLQAACAELAGLGIPAALMHGDLHENNIALRDGVPLFFDWSDACVAHPFLDLATLLRADWNSVGIDPERLRDLYLAQWTDYAPLPRLQEAARLGILLGALHQMVSYQHIVLSQEPAAQWELMGGWISWTRTLVRSLDDRR